MRINRNQWLVVLGVAVVIAVGAAFAMRRGDSIEYFAAKVERGTIRDVVDVTGSVNAVRTVQVGSQVSGTIAKLNADFNSHVHKGDVVALIEPSLLQGALLQATADLESAKANLVAAEANVDKARATLVQAKADYERTLALAKIRAESQAVLDVAKANYDGASASVGAAAANVTQARATIQQKNAAVTVARTNVDHTVIRSPIDGIVVARNVDVGQTVAASLQAPTIFTIAQDLTQMQLYAKTDESDVSRIRVGAPVTFKVDAFPKEMFTGTVSQIRMNATTVQNVVTYDAIIDFKNPDLKVFPGMTAYVTVPVSTVQDVVKVPNGALRYKPPLDPDAIRALYAKYGINPDQKSGATGSDDAQSASIAGTAAPKSGAGAARAARAESAVVWRLNADKTTTPVQVALGITDHAYTEVTSVLKGNLKPGDEVVTASLSAKASGPPGAAVRR
ncbi:MAG: efflux RND transporter periplasmic adaptor subunit [Gemmatimonadota bacterium]|nr:efflux RND transporter periplasmic adaptor subunit [Gemmatimonadota bacterium]